MAKKKESYAVQFARKGGKARAAKLTPARRREIGRLGGLAKARNAKAKGKE
jgi:general stress protein YciG